MVSLGRHVIRRGAAAGELGSPKKTTPMTPDEYAIATYLAVLISDRELVNEDLVLKRLFEMTQRRSEHWRKTHQIVPLTYDPSLEPPQEE